MVRCLAYESCDIDRHTPFYSILDSSLTSSSSPSPKRIRRIGIGRVFGFVSVLRGQVRETESMYGRSLPRAYSNRGYSCSSIAYLTIPYEPECTVCGAIANFHGRLLFSITCPSSALGAERETERADRSAHLHVSCADKTNFEPPRRNKAHGM